MTVTLMAYADAGLTTPLTSLDLYAADDGSSGPVEKCIYLGSVVAGKKFNAKSDPGIAQIVLSITDSNGPTGLVATAVKLALTEIGLDAAVAGAALELGAEILSGAATSVPVWVRVDVGVIAAGTYSDLGVSTNTLIELGA